MFGKVGQFFSHVVPGVIRPMRVLWNEIIGFVFAVFAVMFGFRTFRLAQDGFEGASELLMLIGMSAFTLMLAIFGVSSFWRARKISRS